MEVRVLILLLLCCLQTARGQTLQFVESTYFVTVTEEQPINSNLFSVGAVSLDRLGFARDGTFTLPATNDTQYFSLRDRGRDSSGVNTAEILNTVVFDWDLDTQRQYNFPITFSSQGSSVTAQVVVFIEDINDNTPEFVRDVFEVGVPEELPGGTRVLNVTALDPDQSLQETVLVDRGNNVFDTEVRYTIEHGRITYRITQGNELNHFEINSENGTLSIALGVTLDVDLVDAYNLTVTATDGGGLSDTTSVLIYILDSNDNPPQILAPRGVDVTLPEDTPPGYVILEEINATDVDMGPNAVVTFRIAAGVLRESFSIDETSGRIVVAGPLDREVGSVLDLTVVAEDQGLPVPLRDSIHVLVRLLDVNDYTPTFPMDSYVASVSENAGLDTSVTRVAAQDLDEGVNGTITYSIIQRGASDGGEFYIDPSTGEIFTNASLDRELVSSYELTVMAEDNPTNVSYRLSSEVNLTILVEDFNDNVPTFEQDAYNISILDNVTRREPIIQLTATDKDIGTNGRVTYRVEVADPTYPIAFRIDQDTGTVFRNRRLSFQNQSVFVYTIRALDAGPLRRASDVQLTIILHDVNENPPVFEELSYNATISEDTPVGEAVLNVSALDPDPGAIGEVRYRIVTEFDEAGSFEVNETTGEVTIASPLDFDFREFIFFVVEAYDGGFPEPFTDYVNVTVCLLGVNDEPPSILIPEGVRVSVPENTPPEVEVVVLGDYTVDPDPGEGEGDFSFALVEIYDPLSLNDSFSLNETTGLLRSLREFDRELQPQGIVVAIQTIDFEGISRVTNITISIEDLNDNAPYFEADAFASVHEFLPAGTLVLSNFTAIDEDIGSNADLRYALVGGVRRDMFVLDPLTAELRTAAVLNKTLQDMYNFTVLVVDQGTPQMFGFGAIQVEVLDSNDMFPVFPEPLYNASFSESDPAGTFLLQLNASDGDIGTNANLEYFIVGSSLGGVEGFAINSSTGELFTAAVFDRENISSVELTVAAVDGGLVPHPLTGTTTVLVTILDYNEFAPMFNESFYEAVVTENADNGTFIAELFASDEDATAPNNLIRYSLQGNRSHAFSVDPELGVVTVAGEVDWEEGGVFNITVVASDSALENPLSDEVELMVTVLDVNDRPPVFVPDSLTLGIEENTPVGEGVVVGYVQTTDADSPGNNSDVTFSVLADFTNRKFALDTESGRVTFVRGTLNRERRGSYDLLIRATDHGLPPLHTDATLNISVLDANDFDPVFRPRLYSSSIPELAPLGTPVLTLRATDADMGSNADLRYAITDPLNLGAFEVNETTGVIYVLGALDFQSMRFYPLEVMVSDRGEPSRNDSARVEIFVTDSNTFHPVFEQEEYSVVIRENLASGTTLLQVLASDDDRSPENTAIEYTLGGNSGNFAVDPETGVVYTTTYLDREDISFYNLTLTANNSLSPRPLHSQARLLVSVTDLNDMHPSFDLLVHVSVPEDTPVGSIIHTLQAEDGDEGLNGTVEYSLLEPSQYFQLNATTGELTLLQSLDYEGPQIRYLLPVMATDFGNETLTNYTNVLVSVLDANDHAPSFAGERYLITVDSESVPGSAILSVEVRDEDQDSNADISLSITSGDKGLFEVSDDGTLRTVASLRSQPSGTTFLLTLRANDTEHSAEVNVTVYIQQGVMTSLPFFTSTTYSVSLSEMAPDGAFLVELAPVAENEVSYDIDSEAFSVGPTGRVIVANSSLLDFETFPLHQVTVSIQNSVGERAYAVLDVELTDENEHAPEFVSDSFFVAIPETISVNEAFFTAMAFDRDGATPADVVTYDLDLTDPLTRSRFRINRETGTLTLTRSLNYERGDTGFNLTLRATNSRATPPLPSHAHLEILILNGNNFDPEFVERLHTVNLVEGHRVGDSILNVSASDFDLGSNGELTFGLHGDHRYLDFRIDTFTGEVFTNAELDYERKTFYTLEVVASDGGTPPRTAVVPVEIFIEDVNDNTPIWEREEYSVSIIENATVGSSVIQTNASDIDQVVAFEVNGELVFFSRNGYVTFNITQGDPANNFYIDPDTGLVSVASSLDRELYPEYNLTLTATDGGGRSADAHLLIVVHDINDRVPLFLEDPYFIGVSEDTELETLVLTVHASDTDLNRNSEVVYYFADASDDFSDATGTFYLNDTTGEVTLQAPLDREDTPLYNLTLLAVDMGVVPLTGSSQLLISVLDINEFAPEFSQDGGFEGRVYENKPPGTVILQVNATDMDFGENSTIFYFIVGDHTDVFAIEMDTGVISVAGSIDFETTPEYELIVMATDAGPVSERLVNMTNVTITILDTNDNQPLFSEAFYVTSIPEDSVPGDLVLNVTASDADSTSNAELIYSLDFLSDAEAEMNFVIDALTGTITLASTSNLNRERTPSYDIIVNVTDRGDPPLINAVRVSIVIADVNDNVPQFSLPYFRGAEFENLPPLTPVTMVSATDEDTGANADISFSILQVRSTNDSCFSAPGAGIQDCLHLISTTVNVTDMPFMIDTQSGMISTFYPLDREGDAAYILDVEARDDGVPPLASTTLVLVAVLDRNDESPAFSRDVYLVSISEHSTLGQLVVSVSATDQDSGTNAEVSYSLAGSGEFTVNSLSGDIFTAVANFDRETQDTYNLTVLATDRGMPSLTGSAVVVVAISDENDSPPVFGEIRYNASIRENLPRGSPVIQLNATDADIGVNSALSYHIVSSSPPLSHFAVDPLSGLLTSLQPLDRENVSSYLLTVQARDGGVPPLTGSTQVEVRVADHNDFPPSFISTPYQVSVEENRVLAEPLVRVRAQDADLATNAEIFYSILQVIPLSDAFEIDPDTGDVALIRPLDAESSLTYNITVRADNGPATPPQASEIQVGVAVLDLNDNAPTFEQADYNIPYLESNPQGSEVIRIRALDADATNQHSALSYEITGGHNTSLFEIITTSGVGVVTVAGKLDRESEPTHVLEVTVYDSGTPPHNASTLLTIELQDANDNPPIFEQSSYEFTLQENSPPRTLIGRVRANDIDQQNVSYLLNSTGFEVDSVSGEIFSVAEFDREEQDLHTVLVMATDEGSGQQDVVRTVQVPVEVRILDTNDVTPSFTNSTYTVYVSEATPLSSTILTVEALDKDLGINASFTYSIPPGNDSTSFSVNASTGEVTLEAELDREEQDLFYFLVTAIDMGTPALTGTAQVVVMVLDHNDNVPLFNASSYTAVLDEDTPTGTLVLSVGVTDIDIDENSDITFSLSEDFGRTFSIGEKTGIISLTGPLDYEVAQSYSFRVLAEDAGDPPLSNSSQVFVEVVDLNDNSPQFDSALYQVSIPENAVLGTEVFQVPATDLDSTTNGELRYTILGGNLRSVFSVDEIFGMISVADYLDREITDFYTLDLRVVDLGTPQFTATATLQVTVLDVNDHIPIFDSKTYSIPVPELTEVGTSISTLAASDLDVGSNGDITYAIVAGNLNDTFEIDSRTGILTLTGPLDAKSRSSYALSVQASDGGATPEVPLADTTTVRILVRDENEAPPTFPRDAYLLNVSDNTVVGSAVGHFRATDQDVSSLTHLTYTLLDDTLCFEVDPFEGTVFVTTPLTPGLFNLSLEASDGLFATTIDIYVTVVPFSPNSALLLFDAPTYLFQVAESAQVGSVIGQVSPGGGVVLLGGSDVIGVDNEGNVMVHGDLDRETTPVHVLNLQLPGEVVGGAPAYVVVTIQVLDANDNPPVFESEEYRVTVSESLTPGSTLTHLQALDPDQLPNNTDYTIALLPGGNEGAYFALDPSSGVLFVSSPLDYEANSSYTLTAVAVNNRATPTLSSSTLIFVSLIDENDNSPQFSEMFYQISIPESTQVGTEILTLEASDADSGTNSELVFSITHLSQPLTFVVNQTTGVVATNSTFDLDSLTSYVISASVADRGNPQPRAAATTIFVEVVPNNDDPPMFSNPDGYSIEIPDTLNVGGSIIQVSASDMDSVAYSIQSGGSGGMFAIDPSTGLLTLSGRLDFNARTSHSLLIEAVDGGMPPRTALVEVNITVLDRNSHAPLFDSDTYHVSVFENVTIATSIIQVMATDGDASNVTYQIAVNYYTGGVAAFDIDPVTGVVVTVSGLDREESETIELLVSAVDSGYILRRSTSVPLIVTLLDLNDSPPVFSQPEYHPPLLRLLSSEKSVTRILATDADLVGEEIVYSIMADSSGGLFRIDAETGTIVTAGRVPEATSGYQLIVEASDGEFVTSVAVNLVPVDDGDFCEGE